MARCLQLDGQHAEAAHLRLLVDCAEICQTSTNFMLRRSDLHGHTRAIGAEIYERCVQDCSQFVDAFQMQAYAEVCSSWSGRLCARMQYNHPHLFTFSRQ